MAIPVYLWLKDDGGADIKGSVDVQDREGSIEVVAQEHNLYIPTDNNTGKLTGTRIHTPFLFTKEIDSSSPYLYKAVTTGQTLKSAEFKWYKINDVVDLVPLEFRRLEGLTGGHRLVQIRAGGVDFLGEQERRVDTGAGQFAGVVIGRDVQVMLLSHHFDTAFTILNVDRPFNVRAAVVFQPKINRNCHVNYSISFFDAPSSDDAGVLPGSWQAFACGTRLISTRRLSVRPSGVSLVATGRLSP